MELLQATDKQSVLRKLQLVEKDILMDVVRVCDENDIEYFLSSGTLLGAVRHGGFIPWDDDVDIEMPVKEYYRFLEIAQKCLGEKYFVQNYMTDPNYNFAYTRIRKNNTTFLDVYHQAYQIHHGIWIDIFPVVSVNPGFTLSLKRKWLSLCNFIQIQNSIDSHKEEFKNMLGPCGLFIIRLFSMLPIKTRQAIHRGMLKVVFDADPDKCTHMANVWGNITSVYPKEVYIGEPQWIEFEGVPLKAPHDSIRYLEIKYGDYLTPPPVDQRKGHGESCIIDFENSYEKYMVYPE